MYYIGWKISHGTGGHKLYYKGQRLSHTAYAATLNKLYEKIDEMEIEINRKGLVNEPNDQLHSAKV